VTTTADTLVDRYLKDLDAELRGLPASQRQEILDEVGEHIAAARTAPDADTEAGVRTVLGRLGDPADIAAEARERFGVQAEPARPATPWLEIIALVLLVIPFLGWLVGVVLVWVSRLWTIRDKVIGTLGGMSWVVAGLGTIMVRAVNISLSASGSGTPVGSPGPIESTGPSVVEVILFVAPFVLPIAAAIYLAVRLRGLAGTRPAAG
jgi:uncharacterized membrane protein